MTEAQCRNVRVRMPQAMHAARFANRLAGWPGVAALVAVYARGAQCAQCALPFKPVKNRQAVPSDCRGARLYKSKQVAYA
ncbi:hypothetical protein GCM10027093_16630 [Paraburkholderia jirisanensis]